MKGLELSRAFFERYGAAMIEEKFPEYKSRIAAGLVGAGSQCLGFDDEISRDHDFEPAFCLFILDEDREKLHFPLSRAYSKLPKEFMGIKIKERSAGEGAFGVFTISEFYSRYLKNAKAPEALCEWLSIPDFYLAEATNGEVFCDAAGEFTKIRSSLLNRPEDIRLKKLASAIFYMAQAGQYNYKRCISRGEKAAAALCLSRFCENAAHSVYLLNFAFMPYYKWAVRGMRELLILAKLAEDITALLEHPYDEKICCALIEKICAEVIREMAAQGLCSLNGGDYLEPYAYTVQNKISDVNLRNSAVML